MSRITELNDGFRTSLTGGRLLLTRGVMVLPQETRNKVIEAVRSFDVFTPENDPYGERDFGSVEVDGHTLFWKIDTYKPGTSFHSEDPSDPDKTERVLTVMRSDEY